jgi:outer membrane assembly lipoprotein YfiO
MTGLVEQGSAARSGVCRRVRLGFALAVVLGLTLVSCAATVIPPDDLIGEGPLGTAGALMKRGEYIRAADMLKTYIDRNAGSGQIDLAIYMLGRCYLGTREWAMAQLELERLGREYPESDSSAAGSYALAEAYLGQSRSPDFDQEFTLRALQQLERYLREFPGHWNNPDAEKKVAEVRQRLALKMLNTANLYLREREADAARVYFHRIVEEFDDTPALGEALIGQAVCDAMDGERDSALVQLKELEDKFKKTPLAARASAERHRVEKMKQGVRTSKDAYQVKQLLQ